MSDDESRFARLQRLFERAREEPQERRARLLERECGGDESLRREVEELLAADGPAGDWFGDLGAAVRDSTGREIEAALAPPSRLGPYRLLKILGRGGTGTVYLAERADGQFDQRVAIKVGRRDIGSEGAMGRFLTERQTLAQLRHPNIAQLLDGGITEEALPWFAMEYVEGLAITDYGDARRLGVAERLRLFLQVCDAVDHAHRNLLVHRDLKPGNVLVTEGGTVKLVDFGIAKALADEVAGELTVTGARLLTPAYAAPEQFTGGPITTATDVYGLGTVLYELLVGRRPHEPEGGSLAEMERLVTTTAPARPSGACEAAAAAARGLSPARLRRRLAGDLDRICLKALRREPERRYGSVNELGEDLRRHLRGLPVRARPDTLTYRAGKFLRRHRWSAGVAAVALALLLGFAVAMAALNLQLARQRDRAARLSGTLMSVFEAAGPGGGEAALAALGRVLERGALQVEQELAGEPDLQGDLLSAVARVYQGLGMHSMALSRADAALNLRREVHGNRHPKVAESLERLADLLRAMGSHGAATPFAHEAVTLREQLHGRDDPRVAGSLLVRGRLLLEQGEHEGSGEDLSRALVLLERTDADPLRRAAVLESLGSLHTEQGRYDTADDALGAALELRQQRLLPGHPDLASLRARRAAILSRRGRHEEAESGQREALATLEAELGPAHPRTSETRQELGRTLVALGRLTDAEPVLRRALEDRRDRLGPWHPDVADTALALGQALERLGRVEEAASRYREALKIRRAVFPPQDERVAEAARLRERAAEPE